MPFRVVESIATGGSVAMAGLCREEGFAGCWAFGKKFRYFGTGVTDTPNEFAARTLAATALEISDGCTFNHGLLCPGIADVAPVARYSHNPS